MTQVPETRTIGRRRWRRLATALAGAAMAAMPVAAARAQATGPGSATGARPPTTRAGAGVGAGAKADDGWFVDWRKKTAIGFEWGLGSVITSYSVGEPDRGSLLFTGFKATYDLTDPWGFEVMFRQWWLSGSNQVIVLPAAGARYEPYRDQAGRAHVEASLGIGWTSNGTGLAFDMGGGFEFELPNAPGLGLGPFLRYGHVTSPDSNSDRDGRAWMVGVSFQYHLGRAAEAKQAALSEKPAAEPPPKPYEFKVPDSDNDGITDESDQCRTVPAGKRPDVYRPGCPEDDTDEDGVPDSEDACPLSPAGNEPDPKWPGCPFADADKDGIPDLDDRCPSQPGKPSDDPTKIGCPEPVKKTAAPKGPSPAAPSQTRKGAMR
jgi:hypothetical protein